MFLRSNVRGKNRGFMLRRRCYDIMLPSNEPACDVNITPSFFKIRVQVSACERLQYMRSVHRFCPQISRCLRNALFTFTHADSAPDSNPIFSLLGWDGNSCSGKSSAHYNVTIWFAVQIRIGIRNPGTAM